MERVPTVGYSDRIKSVAKLSNISPPEGFERIVHYWTFESVSQESSVNNSARVIAGIAEWHLVLVRSILLGSRVCGRRRVEDSGL